MPQQQPTLFDVANHANLGKGFEADLDVTHKIYRRRQIADIVKNAEKTVFCTEAEYAKNYAIDRALVLRDGNNRPLRRLPSDVDFSGGGRHPIGGMFAICFDAKFTTEKNFPLKMLKPHQIARLGESARCGNLAGFMICMAAYKRVFWMPYAVADRKYVLHEISARQNKRAKPGTASFTIADLEETCIEIPYNKADSIWDWLPVLVK